MFSQRMAATRIVIVLVFSIRNILDFGEIMKCRDLSSAGSNKPDYILTARAFLPLAVEDRRRQVCGGEENLADVSRIGTRRPAFIMSIFFDNSRVMV